MFINFFKIIFLCFFFFNSNILYSKNLNFNTLNTKELSNYFSALVSLNNHQNAYSLKFFNNSKNLKESNELYLKKYLFSLILNEKVSKAINEVNQIKNKSLLNFFEAQLLIVLDMIKQKNYKESAKYINNLKIYKTEDNFKNIILSVLEEYIYLFANNKLDTNLKFNLGNLSLINRAFQNCYLEKPITEVFFKEIINSPNGDYSRYLFFYLNYLISQNNVNKIKNEVQNINSISATLLVAQSKKWIDDENFDELKKIFSCKDPNHLIGEFFFLISNLHSSEGNLNKSNYYFNLSSYFNPKFKFNSILLVENYSKNNDFTKVKKILKKFDKKDEIYHWYKIKKITEIINEEATQEQSLKYLNSQFNKIKNPSLRTVYDMGNIVKSFKEYDLSIKYYSKVLSQLNQQSSLYADILYRRGGSYERLGKEKKADKDLIKSLKINSNEPHVLNYLAYSWLERNYKIDIAISMLENAYEQEPNDPYIIDSIGWAYYLLGDYVKAEILMRKALEIMPYDPVVNDHYGDIVWMLDRKIQAIYFWESVLTFDDTEEYTKKEIYLKLLRGLKKI